MTEQSSEIHPDAPMAPEGAFSANGSEPRGSVDEPSFLADLAKAMQTTAAAERARDVEATGQRRQAHVDGIRAREALEAEDLRELAKEDVSGIDAWSDGEIRRIKLERERRIATRREELQTRLEEHRRVVGREIAAVESAVGSYQQEMDAFFSRLESETDPVEIAQQAGARPRFPVLELIGPEDAPEETDAADASGQNVPAATVDTPDATVDTPDTVGAPTPDSAEATTDGSTQEQLIGVMGRGQDAAPDEIQPPVGLIGEPSEAIESVVTTPGAEATMEPGREAQVVTPRVGAGSWLRWPNKPEDRSGSNQ